jgi:prepilin-type N-terminal cleavage/methylation domain-containing protein
MKTNTQNNKGFTLIELIMVTIILGILAAVAIPRYTATVERAEQAAENAVISSIKSGLETYATEQLLDNGRRSWPVNPFLALDTSPSGYSTDITDADSDSEWTFNTTSNSITHMRGDNSLHHWDYVQGVTTSGLEAVGTLGGRDAGSSI